MFELPKLPYDYDALEPHIDARTMEIHHTKHHQGYTDKLNKAIEGTDHAGKDIEDILGAISEDDTAIRNNGGGYYNHKLFWNMMSPDGGGTPSGELADAINETFGSFEKFQEEFTNAAKSRFGSGWAWLVKDESGKLQVTSTPNQDSPVMKNIVPAEQQGTPILGLDVWEHAYYLNYQNKRPDYIDAWWNVVDWGVIEESYKEIGDL